MSKEWYEDSSEELAGGFSEERQVHHLQATCENIGIKYVGAPDAPAGFVDVVVSADVIAVAQESQEYYMPVMFALGVYLRVVGLSD